MDALTRESLLGKTPPVISIRLLRRMFIASTSPRGKENSERVDAHHRISWSWTDRLHCDKLLDTRAKGGENRVCRSGQPAPMGRNSRGRLGYTIRSIREGKDSAGQARVLPS